MVESAVTTSDQLHQPAQETPRFNISSMAQELSQNPGKARGVLTLFKQTTITMQMLAEQRDAAWAETPGATVDAAKRLFWLVLNSGNPTTEAESAFLQLCQTKDATAIGHALNALDNSYRHPEPRVPDDMRDVGLAQRIDELRQAIIASVVETKQHLLDNGALRGWYKETMKDLVEEAARKGMIEA